MMKRRTFLKTAGAAFASLMFGSNSETMEVEQEYDIYDLITERDVNIVLGGGDTYYNGRYVCNIADGYDFGNQDVLIKGTTNVGSINCRDMIVKSDVQITMTSDIYGKISADTPPHMRISGNFTMEDNTRFNGGGGTVEMCSVSPTPHTKFKDHNWNTARGTRHKLKHWERS